MLRFLNQVSGGINSITQQSDRISEIKQWFGNIEENGFHERCGTQHSVDQLELLVKLVPCHESKSLKQYSFSGELSDKFSGSGILDLTSVEQQKKCIAIGSLPDNLPRPDKIEANFVNGAVSNKVQLTWTQLELQMTVLVRDGVAIGSFVAKQPNLWMTGEIGATGKIGGPCWIRKPTKVFHGNCSGLFHLDRTSTRVIFIYNDFTQMVIGKLEDETHILGNESTIEVMSVSGNKCGMYMKTKSSAPQFSLNTDTLERDYKVKTENFCAHSGLASGGGEALGPTDTQEAILSYMKSLKPSGLSKEPFDESNVRKLITNLDLTNEESHQYEATMNLFRPVNIEFTYLGLLDDNGQFHGDATFLIDTKAVCFRGLCEEGHYEKLTGHFVHGDLEGLVALYSIDEAQITYGYAKGGTVHSTVVAFGLLALVDKSVGIIEDMKQFGIAYVGNFLNGRPEGKILYGMMADPIESQSYLVGILNKKYELSGDNIAYLYPRAKKALVGTFADKKMVAAKFADITRVTCKNNILELEFSQPLEQTEFFYESSTNETIGNMPLVQDPYEAWTVEVKQSTIPDSGLGVFAKRDIEFLEIVDLYNGFRFNRIQHAQFLHNCSKHYDDKVCIKYSIQGCHNELMLDFSPFFADLQQYNATVAHLANCGIDPHTNAKLAWFEHPRFGHIRAHVATKNIARGEEIFLDYKYQNKAEETDYFPWYFEAKKKSLEAENGAAN